MKRTIAMLLIFVLLAAMFPAANAAAPEMPKLEIRTADVLELTSVPNRYEIQSDTGLYDPNWIEPRFETYGLSAVIGEEMVLYYHEGCKAASDQGGLQLCILVCG